MSSKATKLVLKKNKKLDKIYHPDTGLVFKSATEKVVIGRIVDDEFVPLDDEAVELCEQNQFKVDESLLESEETEEQPAEKKKTSKKKSDEVEEESDEDESPKKKASQEEKAVIKDKAKPVAKEDESENTPASKDTKPVASKAKAPANDSVDGFAAILNRHTKELQDFVSARQAEAQADKDKITELVAQLATTKKELEDVRKKLKGVLSAMQGDL